MDRARWELGTAIGYTDKLDYYAHPPFAISCRTGCHVISLYIRGVEVDIEMEGNRDASSITENLICMYQKNKGGIFT